MRSSAGGSNATLEASSLLPARASRTPSAAFLLLIDSWSLEDRLSLARTLEGFSCSLSPTNDGARRTSKKEALLHARRSGRLPLHLPQTLRLFPPLVGRGQSSA